MPEIMGLKQMAPARLPMEGSNAAGIISVYNPSYGPEAPPPPLPDDPEISIIEIQKVDPIKSLIGKFYAEVDVAKEARRAKERIWIKIDKYMSGKDVQEPPEGYEESTFMYRRLPRLVQIGKEKLYKHVRPIHEEPWDVQSSPRKLKKQIEQVKGEFTPEQKIKNLKEEIKDIHEASEVENLLDDMTEFMSHYGSAVVYGPIRLSEPRISWQDGSEEINEEDKMKPMWELKDPRCVYPDPSAKDTKSLGYIHFREVLSPHQLRSLSNDLSFIKSEIADLLINMKGGNWLGNLEPWESEVVSNTGSQSYDNRYVVWMRVGFLDVEALETIDNKYANIPELEEFKNLDEEQKRALTESLWEIWFCDNYILKIAKREFQPKKLPVYFVPFRKDPTSIFGVGIAESALEVTEMLINITRAIDDSLADTSGYQAIVDAGAIENKDLRVRPRKTWIYRNKGTGRKEGAYGGRPIDFFTVPSNLPHLMECFKLFESMYPVVTGVAEAVTGADMGSGVRTDQMMTDVWQSLEEFLRATVGNVDRYWWKPHLRDTYNWIQKYYTDRDELKIEANLVVSGVRGALRREIVGRKVKDLYLQLNQFGIPGHMNEKEMVKAIAEGMGIDSEKAVLTPEQYEAKQELLALEKAKMAQAGMAPENEEKAKERAHTSSRDAVLETLRATLTSNPNSPVLPALYEESFKLTGQLNPRAAAGISILAKLLAQQYEQMGTATNKEAEILGAPVVATNPLELSPDARNQDQAKMAAQAGQSPQTPPNPLPPMPTTQQIVTEQ